MTRTGNPNELPSNWVPILPMIYHVSANNVAREESSKVLPIVGANGDVTPSVLVAPGTPPQQMNFIQEPVVYNHLTILIVAPRPSHMRTFAWISKIPKCKKNFQSSWRVREKCSARSDKHIRTLQNNAETRYLVLLQKNGVFASNAPVCNKCNPICIHELQF